jgi:Protein of unknown function (DUF3892)
MSRHQHIVAVELSNGIKWDVYPTAVAKIRQGIQFYTYAGGRRAVVYAKACGRCRNPYLTTSPDDTTANNLDYLPLF